MSKDDAPNASAIPANDSGELFNEINPLHDSLVSWRSYAWEEPPDALRALILEAFSRQYASKKARAKRSWRLPSWLSFEFTPRLGIAMAGAAMLAVLVMAGALFIVLQNQGPALVATAENVSGSVEVNYVGSQAWTAVQEGTQFQAGDRIRSDQDSSASLRFPDDSVTAMGASSQIAIFQLSESSNGAGQVVVLHQYTGQTDHKIQPQTGADAWFEVESAAASIKVVGTEFSVEITEYQGTVVIVKEGTVAVRGAGAELMASAGETANVMPNSEPALGLPTLICPEPEKVEQPLCGSEQETTSQPAQPGSVEASAGLQFDQDPKATATKAGRSTATPTVEAGATSSPEATPTKIDASPTPAATPGGLMLATLTPTSPSSGVPTATPSIPPTNTPQQPTATTAPGEPTSTPELPPTSTPIPPTSTPLPPPTSTPIPPTSTPVPPTSTPVPPTSTPVPPTSTPQPPPPTSTPPPYPTSPPPPTPTPPSYP